MPCEIEITTEINHLSCSVCELNYCISCTTISKLLVEALKEDTTNNFKWTCNGCKQNFPCMTGLRQQLKNIEEQTNERISNLEIKVKSIDTEMDANINQKFENLKPTIVKEIKDELKSELQEDVRKEVYEIEDQRKMLNLIIFNLPESEEKYGEARKSHDISEFTELCNKLQVENIDRNTVYRIGKPSPSSTRPLKIILNNKKQRKEIIDKASLIKTIPPSSYLSKFIIAKLID